MSERRINPAFEKDERKEDKLKHIGGLIQKLNYREMIRFAALLKSGFEIPALDTGEIADELIEIADRLIQEPRNDR